MKDFTHEELTTIAQCWLDLNADFRDRNYVVHTLNDLGFCYGAPCRGGSGRRPTSYTQYWPAVVATFKQRMQALLEQAADGSLPG